MENQPTVCGDVSTDAVSASADQVRSWVRERYANTTSSGGAVETHAERIGYTSEDLRQVPEGANLGLGCGNPTALAALQPGEVVVDLGSGAGFDALLAARKVAPTGHVIGIDMTREMLRKARENAVHAGLADLVEFREGIIEELPVVSGSADVVISNCVINLSPDKTQVFREIFRVLKSGGRIAISDILLTAQLPAEVTSVAAMYAECVGGAVLADTYLHAIREAGFGDIEWTRVSAAPLFEGFANTNDPVIQELLTNLGAERAAAIAQTLWSYKIEASKP
jgi:arsenite methyltransferase